MPPNPHRWQPVALLALGLLFLGPLWITWIESRNTAADFHIPAPAAVAGWSTAESFTEWKPRYINPTDERQYSFSDGTGQVGVYLAFYGRQAQDAELINSQNVMVVQKHPVWREPSRAPRSVQVDGRRITVIESRLESKTQNLLVWHWMRAAGQDFSDPLLGKIHEALGVLRGAGREGFGIVVYAPYTDQPDAVRARLQTFLDAMLPSIDAALKVD